MGIAELHLQWNEVYVHCMGILPLAQYTIEVIIQYENEKCKRFFKKIAI